MEGEKEVEELQESQHPKPEVEYPTDSKAYSLLAKIGQGAFASVYKASFNDGNIIAVKVLNLDKVDSNLNEIRMEVQLMRLSLHPNILPCFTAFLSSSASSNLLWVVSPFMNKGSAVQALQYVRRRKDININMEKHIWYILRETLQGLQYIHENGQIHRDVKGSNILLDESSSVKIADFGVSGWLIPQNEKAKTFVGTPCWVRINKADGFCDLRLMIFFSFFSFVMRGFFSSIYNKFELPLPPFFLSRRWRQRLWNKYMVTITKQICGLWVLLH